MRSKTSLVTPKLEVKHIPKFFITLPKSSDERVNRKRENQDSDDSSERQRSVEEACEAEEDSIDHAVKAEPELKTKDIIDQ